MQIGILGGTFDPIHYGHIRPTIEVKHALALDKILLLPNHIPPHKQAPNLSTQQRLTMVNDVCQQINGFELCDIEAKRNTPSYTVLTLELLKAQYPHDSLYFIMGMDSFIHLPNWYQWQRLFELAHIVVCQRPGWQLSPDSVMQQVLQQRQVTADSPTPLAAHGLIFPVTVTEQAISSTQIRAALAKGNIPHDALMPVTLDYIQKQQLYGHAPQT